MRNLLGLARFGVPCVLLPLLLVSCETLPSHTSDPAGLSASADEADEKSKDKAKQAKQLKAKKNQLKTKRAELEGLERKLQVAQLELKVAKRKAESDERANDLEQEEAQRALQTAERALARFEGVTQPIKEAEDSLTLARAERRLVEEREELQGVLEIYDDELEARNKDIVIERYRRRVEFAEKAFDIAQRKSEDQREGEWPKLRAALEEAVLKARTKLEGIRTKREQQDLAAELQLTKKEHAVLGAQDELDKLDEAVQKLLAAIDEAELKKSDK